ncbi:MAG: helix-turn-helix domain-containing protein [Rhodospirillales bacterium]
MHAHAVSTIAAKIDLAGLAAGQGMGQRARIHIAAIGSIQRVDQGTTLFSEGDRAENVYQVVSGMLRLYKALPDGRRQITGFLSAGHHLGLSLNDLYLYSAEAITEVNLRRYPRAWFERLVDEVPGLARRLLAATSDELRAAQDQMLLLGRKTAGERIASFLIMLSDQHSNSCGEDTIHVPMSRNDIADYLGLTMETVSRMLAKLKRLGAIALPSPTRITLFDRERLQDLAAGELEPAL